MGFKDKYSGIYTITNLINNKVYVGKTTTLNSRGSDHISALKRNGHPNTRLQNSFNKYGKENFIFQILIECDKEDLSSEEHYWCNLLDSHNEKYGFNIKPTNPLGTSGHSEETIQKLKNTWTEDRRKKHSKFHSNKVINKESLERTLSATRKAIVCLNINGEFIQEFISVNEASRQLSISQGSISRCLIGDVHRYKSLIFMYKEAYNSKNDYSLSSKSIQTDSKYTIEEVLQRNENIRDDYLAGHSIKFIKAKYKLWYGKIITILSKYSIYEKGRFPTR